MSFTSFRAVRWLRTLNLVLQAVLFITLVGGLNYVAKSHAWRFDLTKQRKFSLSPETLSYLKTLPRPVHLIVTGGKEDENPELKGLLHEFRYATESREIGRVTTELLDLYQNRRRAEELGIENSDVIVIMSGDKRRVIRMDELYSMKDRQRHAFQGEQVLTAGILDVASAERLKIYFLVGHAEMRLSDPDASRGLTAARDQLKLRNFEVEEIDLTVARKIPEDADLLIAVAPQSSYSKIEQEMLRQYLSANAGRMVLFLAPGISASALGLDDLLLDWGVLVHDDLIWDNGPENIAENGDLLLYAFTQHPVTQTLLDYGWKLRLGVARTVLPDPGRSAGSGLNTVALVATSTTAWGERDYRRGEFKYTPGIDTRPIRGLEPADRLSVAVASERLAVRDNLPFSVRGGKLVVFGTGDMIANSRLDNSNLAVLLNTVNWSVDRDRQLSVPPRPIERFQLSLSAADFTRLRYAVLLGLPGAALALGLIVYWTRRN
jgi:hypothetical protein